MRGVRRLIFLPLDVLRNQPFVLPTFTVLLPHDPGRSTGLGGPLLAFVMMLRIVFLAFLSSLLLPFTSQTPLQGDGLHQAQEELVLERLQWNPVPALTSKPYKKREDDRGPYGPLSALTSAFGRRDDGYGPVSGFSSTQFYRTNGPNGRRHFTEAPSIRTTTLVTTTRAPAKQSSTPTSNSKSSPPTTSAVPVPTKTLNDCNVQGTASTSLISNLLDKYYAADPLSCQLLCMYRSRCESYSFQAPSPANAKNCVFYSTYIDGSLKVVSSSSGIYFSDKYPSDGSNFCYGSDQL